MDSLILINDLKDFDIECGSGNAPIANAITYIGQSEFKRELVIEFLIEHNLKNEFFASKYHAWNTPLLKPAPCGCRGVVHQANCKEGLV